ncbi:hypothetical protein DSM104299_00893 [Baekduia alba]|uniref:hypothetical protein n=1 Tax=Baekduia alba TaxID=2997333 RepID=UPI00234146F3|nr:hypothetical protein [Baekduia alba]WCB92203.1 hypothetical protein DSM104299_00893 [Baekduia alba]
MRRLGLGLLVVALAAAGALAAIAFGQGDIVPIKISATVKVTPNKAGTPRHPQGVRIDARANISIPDDYDPPLVQTVDIWFPKAGNYNGGKFPTCGEAAMAHHGVSVCPKGSIMGHGRAKARADTVFTYPKITVVNGGATKVYFYVVLQVPARVAQPVAADISKLSGNPRWGYRLHAKIPRNLQIVAGIPLRYDSMHLLVGRGDWIATTSCPRDHRWRYHAEAAFDTGQVVKYDGSVGCRS